MLELRERFKASHFDSHSVLSSLWWDASRRSHLRELNPRKDEKGKVPDGYPFKHLYSAQVLPIFRSWVLMLHKPQLANRTGVEPLFTQSGDRKRPHQPEVYRSERSDSSRRFQLSGLVVTTRTGCTSATRTSILDH